MKLPISIALLCVFLLGATSCTGQTGRTSPQNPAPQKETQDTPPIYLGMPDELDAEDYSAGWEEPGEQQLLLTGTVFQSDGLTPAPDVLLYYYHTNPGGRYVHKPEIGRSMPPNSQGHSHGYLRGWVKTGPDGKYAIYTIRPGSYPSGDEVAHVHVTVKEPDWEEFYYIDDFVFDDDRRLVGERRKRLESRGGSGVLRIVKKGDLQIGERNIILGLNVPDYPKKVTAQATSGKSMGEDLLSFTPFHAWGPDKGSKACPICKYGRYHGVLYFVGNDPDWGEIRAWLKFLEQESVARGKFLKVYFVYGNENGYDKAKRMQELAALGIELQLEKLALTFVPSFADETSKINLLGLDGEMENTFLVYRRSNVIGNFTNLKPTAENFALLTGRLAATQNEYFNLPRIGQGE